MEHPWQKWDCYRDIINMKSNGIVPASVYAATVYEQDPDFFKELQEECPHVTVETGCKENRRHEHTHTDDWGCVWHFPGGFLDGQVTGHPLEDLSVLSRYTPPDPADHTNWEKEAESIRHIKEEGCIARGSLEHGFFYLRLTYLRGFNNFMMDVAEESSELFELIDIVGSYWYEVVNRWIGLGVDIIIAGDDLGHQDALPMSPASWRKIIKPTFSKIFSLCRESGVEVYLHTDGYINDIVPDLIETGVTVLNPQDLVNGLDNLKRLAKGKICIDLDIDRQDITPFGTPDEIDAHIGNCVKTLGSPDGGLTLIFGAYPGTPLVNIGQVVRSMETYHDWWVGK